MNLSSALMPSVALRLLVVGLVVFACPLWGQDGWITLFDGKTLSGWNTIGGVK